MQTMFPPIVVFRCCWQSNNDIHVSRFGPPSAIHHTFETARNGKRPANLELWASSTIVPASKNEATIASSPKSNGKSKKTRIAPPPAGIMVHRFQSVAFILGLFLCLSGLCTATTAAQPRAETMNLEQTRIRRETTGRPPSGRASSVSDHRNHRQLSFWGWIFLGRLSK
jgi:hypothetical protein